MSDNTENDDLDAEPGSYRPASSRTSGPAGFMNSLGSLVNMTGNFARPGETKLPDLNTKEGLGDAVRRNNQARSGGFMGSRNDFIKGMKGFYDDHKEPLQNIARGLGKEKEAQKLDDYMSNIGKLPEPGAVQTGQELAEKNPLYANEDDKDRLFRQATDEDLKQDPNGFWTRVDPEQEGIKTGAQLAGEDPDTFGKLDPAKTFKQGDDGNWGEAKDFKTGTQLAGEDGDKFGHLPKNGIFRQAQAGDMVQLNPGEVSNVKDGLGALQGGMGGGDQVLGGASNIVGGIKAAKKEIDKDHQKRATARYQQARKEGKDHAAALAASQQTPGDALKDAQKATKEVGSRVATEAEILAADAAFGAGEVARAIPGGRKVLNKVNKAVIGGCMTMLLGLLASCGIIPLLMSLGGTSLGFVGFFENTRQTVTIEKVASSVEGAMLDLMDEDEQFRLAVYEEAEQMVADSRMPDWYGPIIKTARAEPATASEENERIAHASLRAKLYSNSAWDVAAVQVEEKNFIEKVINHLVKEGYWDEASSTVIASSPEEKEEIESAILPFINTAYADESDEDAAENATKSFIAVSDAPVGYGLDGACQQATFKEGGDYGDYSFSPFGDKQEAADKMHSIPIIGKIFDSQINDTKNRLEAKNLEGAAYWTTEAGCPRDTDRLKALNDAYDPGPSGQNLNPVQQIAYDAFGIKLGWAGTVHPATTRFLAGAELTADAVLANIAGADAQMLRYLFVGECRGDSEYFDLLCKSDNYPDVLKQEKDPSYPEKINDAENPHIGCGDDTDSVLMDYIVEAAAAAQIDPAVLYGLIIIENGGFPAADKPCSQSSAGALGIMQLMPGSWKAVKPWVASQLQVPESELDCCLRKDEATTEQIIFSNKQSIFGGAKFVLDRMGTCDLYRNPYTPDPDDKWCTSDQNNPLTSPSEQQVKYMGYRYFGNCDSEHTYKRCNQGTCVTGTYCELLWYFYQQYAGTFVNDPVLAEYAQNICSIMRDPADNSTSPTGLKVCYPYPSYDATADTSCVLCADYVSWVDDETNSVLLPSGADSRWAPTMMEGFKSAGRFYTNGTSSAPQSEGIQFGDVVFWSTEQGGGAAHVNLVCGVQDYTLTLCQYNARHEIKLVDYDKILNRIEDLSTLQAIGWGKPVFQ